MADAKPAKVHDREGSALTFLAFLIVGFVVFLCWIADVRMHLTSEQIIEIVLVGTVSAWILYDTLHYYRVARPKQLSAWPPASPRLQQNLIAEQVEIAAQNDSILLGHETSGEPVYWSHEARAWQTIVSGMTGAGKTTLIESVLQQDIARGLPIIFFDGKGERKMLDKMLPVIEAAGRMGDLRLIDPTQPQHSVGFNPFWSPHGDPDEHVAFVFESFRVDAGDQDFFDKHQKVYLNNIARILHYTGKKYNFYDLLVAAYDAEQLNSLIKIALKNVSGSQQFSYQQRLNLEMSIRNLLETFADKERVSKIQGLINNLVTFLSDSLSMITGPYENLLTIEDVLSQKLILYVNLNVNIDADAVVSLGRIILQNLQLALGRLYADTGWGTNHQFVSVLLDEFAPFAYANFSRILQTARGANVGFLFALQTYGQLEPVGFGLKDSLTSGPNNSFMLRMKDDNTSSQFRSESGEMKKERVSVRVEKAGMLGDGEYKEQGSGTKSVAYETQVTDEMLKALPRGQMQVLMSDNVKGLVHKHVHVRKSFEHHIKSNGNNLYPTLAELTSESDGLNLRFPDSSFTQQSKETRRRGKGRSGKDQWK